MADIIIVIVCKNPISQNLYKT